MNRKILTLIVIVLAVTSIGIAIGAALLVESLFYVPSTLKGERIVLGETIVSSFVFCGFEGYYLRICNNGTIIYVEISKGTEFRLYDPSDDSYYLIKIHGFNNLDVLHFEILNHWWNPV